MVTRRARHEELASLLVVIDRRLWLAKAKRFTEPLPEAGAASFGHETSLREVRHLMLSANCGQPQGTCSGTPGRGLAPDVRFTHRRTPQRFESLSRPRKTARRPRDTIDVLTPEVARIVAEPKRLPQMDEVRRIGTFPEPLTDDGLRSPGQSSRPYEAASPLLQAPASVNRSVIEVEKCQHKTTLRDLNRLAPALSSSFRVRTRLAPLPDGQCSSEALGMGKLSSRREHANGGPGAARRGLNP